ncbi:MAG: DUF2948 family protein [Pseudomonadota bacterium]
MALIRPLKLAALDEEDLGVLSAHVQDAVVKVVDIKWSPAAGTLILPMNRFAWEETKKGKRRANDQRRRAVLHFDRVTRVRSHGINTAGKDDVISILTVHYEVTEAPAGVISLVCSGDAAMQLEVECIEARLTDLGAAWSASMRPQHRVGGA